VALPWFAERLEMARRHVADGHRLVASQRRIVATKRKQGFDPTLSEDLLNSFEQSLAAFEDDLTRLLKQSRQ